MGMSTALRTRNFQLEQDLMSIRTRSQSMADPTGAGGMAMSMGFRTSGSVFCFASAFRLELFRVLTLRCAALRVRSGMEEKLLKLQEVAHHVIDAYFMRFALK